MELTWQDVKKIVEIADKLLNICTDEMVNIYPTEESYYTQVLNEFNEYKDGTTGSENNIK